MEVLYLDLEGIIGNRMISKYRNIDSLISAEEVVKFH